MRYLRQTQFLERVIRRSRIFPNPRLTWVLVYYISLKMASVLCCVVLCCPVLFAIGGQMAGTIGLKSGTKHSLELFDEDRRSRVRIDARAARTNMRTAPHIQHMWQNGRTGRAPNWYTHSLGQRAEVMGVGDRECPLMCALH
jgi:hypothetical protein